MKLNTLISFFSFVCLFFRVLSCEGIHEKKKINLKIELIDKDVLLSDDHLKKEKVIMQDGRKIKIKNFERIKENVLERAIIVKELDKLKYINTKKEAITLETLDDDNDDDENNEVSSNDENNNDENNSNENNSNENNSNENNSNENNIDDSQQVDEEQHNMKVISSEESVENDIHMLRKVYQRDSENGSTTYCYMRYTFNFNLEKLNENSRSQLFKGLDKTLDYLSFLPKNEDVTDTESILDNEYKMLDNTLGDTDPIVSNVELKNYNFDIISTSEYADTIDEIINFLNTRKDQLNISTSLKYKLMEAKNNLNKYNNKDMLVNNPRDSNLYLYEWLQHLNKAFLEKKKALELLNDTKDIKENYNDKLFANSVEQLFYCYNLFDVSNDSVDSFFLNNMGNKKESEEVNINIHKPLSRELLSKNIDDNADDELTKCKSFLSLITPNELFLNDDLGISHNDMEKADIDMNQEEDEDEEYENNKNNDMLLNNLNVQNRDKLVKSMGEEDGVEDSKNYEMNNNEMDSLDVSSLRKNKSYLENKEAFSQLTQEIKNDEMTEDYDYSYDIDSEEENKEGTYEDSDEEKSDEESDEEFDEENDYDNDDDNDDDSDEEFDEEDDYDNDEENDYYNDEDDEESDEELDEEVYDNDYENLHYKGKDNYSNYSLKSALSDLAKSGTNHLIDKATNSISSALKKNFNKKKITDKSNKLFDKISKGLNNSKKIINKTKKDIKKGINKGAKLIKDTKKDVKKHVKNTKEKGKNLTRKAKKVVKKGNDIVKENAQIGLNKVKKGTKNGINKVKKGAKNVKEGTKNGINKVKDGAENGINIVKEGVNNGKNKIKEGSKDGINKLKNEVDKGVNKVKEYAQNGVNQVKNGTINALEDAIKEISKPTGNLRFKEKESINKVNTSPNKVTNKKGKTPLNNTKSDEKKKSNGRKMSLISLTEVSNKKSLNKNKIKKEINKINKEYKKLKKMENKMKKELNNPIPSDKKIISEFDDFEKSNEVKKNKNI
ncbi:hypothetical protein PFMC_04922 [Plasmodium falciparum CAMP/Malaysia]|uniref:Secreted ookinete protein n=1 Tax=Plasmodium falciparum (isolate Camp / Malaysia) TaxID=5835 RepID=A0A024X155_PLAFC|nr:hypothetical protein PFMC_04922 [Plasmodium falciparum CAMP/Malaysia]